MLTVQSISVGVKKNNTAVTKKKRLKKKKKKEANAGGYKTHPGLGLGNTVTNVANGSYSFRQND